MPWGKLRKGGWAATPADEPVSRFTQIIRTIINVVPGGVIRYAKDGPDDDAHTGFWLGVTTGGVARFSVGGPAWWLKWDGSQLLVRGKISTLGGDATEDRLRWIGADGEDIGYLQATDAWGHILEMRVPRTDAAGDPGMLDLFVDGDFAALVRLRLYTERGGGAAASKMVLQIGNGMDVFVVSGEDNSAWVRGVVKCADPTADTHALTRRAGDDRYVSKAAGWSGSFRTGNVPPDEIATVTVANGQITAVM